MRAMVLTAGLGTRLWPLTHDRPKASMPLAGRWLCEHVLDWLAGHGIGEATLNLHHHGEVLEQRLGARAAGIALRYSREPELLGTGGALDPVRDWLAERGTFVIVNGKLVTRIDLGRALAVHRRSGALATLVLRPNPDPRRFSQVLAAPAPGRGDRDQGLSVLGFRRPWPGAPVEPDPLMFTGVALWEPALLARVPHGRPSDVVTSVYEPLIADGLRLGAVVDPALWLEPSTLCDYRQAALSLGGSLDPEARIAPSAEVEGSVVWAGARIEAGARVDRSIIGSGVVVAAGTELVGEALVRDAKSGTLLRRPID